MLYQTSTPHLAKHGFGLSVAKLALVLILSGCELAESSDIAEATISKAKRHVYSGDSYTLYCGCPITYSKSARNPDAVNLNACGFEAKQNGIEEASHLAWEYIVPVSYLRNPEDRTAFALDLHNVAPVENQIKRYRKSAKHGYVGHPVTLWGNHCTVRFNSDGQESSDQDTLEPQDCTKGDIARVWLYANGKYDLEINEIYMNNYRKWDKKDPVSLAEKSRHDKIVALQDEPNPYIDGVTATSAGSCPWER